MANKNSNSTTKDPSKRPFNVQYNDELQKLFHGITKRIRTSADVHLLLERPLPVISNSSKAKKNTNIVGVTSNLRKLDLKPNTKRDKIVESEIEKTVSSIFVPAKQADSICETVIKDLKTDLKRHRFPEVKFIVYGSYKNGLCTTHSDTIDLSCEYGENMPSSAKTLVLKFKEIFKSSSSFRVEEFHKAARVPIIKLSHKGVSKKVNVTFFNDFAIRNLCLTKLYLNLNPNLRTMTLYLKELMFKYELCGKFKITTHVLFWLVVYFLQQKGLLPAVKDVRRAASEKCFISGWNCSVPERMTFSIENQPTVCSLLFDFFVFYKDMNFLKYVMSPYHGCAFAIEEFESEMPIPAEAVDDESLRNSNSFFRRCLNMQDPVILNYNLTVTLRIEIVNSFQLLCYRFATDDLLREKIPPKSTKMAGYKNNPPNDFERYSSFDVFLRDIPTPWWADINRHVRETVRKVMEMIFEFELDNMVEENVTQIVRRETDCIERTSQVLYFDYCCSQKTWKNGYFLDIIYGGLKSGERGTEDGDRDDGVGKVDLICEIDRDKKLVYVYVRSGDRMSKFLFQHLGRLMLFVLLLDVPNR